MRFLVIALALAALPAQAATAWLLNYTDHAVSFSVHTANGDGSAWTGSIEPGFAEEIETSELVQGYIQIMFDWRYQSGLQPCIAWIEPGERLGFQRLGSGTGFVLQGSHRSCN